MKLKATQTDDILLDRVEIMLTRLELVSDPVILRCYLNNVSLILHNREILLSLVN